MFFKGQIKDNISAVYNSINSNTYSSDLFFKVRDYIEKYPNDETFKREYDYLNSRVNFNTEPVNSEEE